MATESSSDSRTFCSEDPLNYVHLPFFTILRTTRSSYQRYLHKLSFTGRKSVYHPLYSSNMYRLPPELLREVFDYIDDDQVTLKALRFVDMRFADVAARHLYKTLVVFQHPDSWHKLELSAACPWLGPLVRKLDVAALNTIHGNLSTSIIRRRIQQVREDI